MIIQLETQKHSNATVNSGDLHQQRTEAIRPFLVLTFQRVDVCSLVPGMVEHEPWGKLDASLCCSFFDWAIGEVWK